MSIKENKNIFPLFFIISSSVIFLVIFSIFPNIDIIFSSLFYDSERGFFLQNSFLAIFFYKLIPILTVLIPIYSILSIFFYKKCKKIFLSSKEAIYILTVIIFVPGIIVNSILKDNFGRARPADIIEFSGNLTFTPAFYISNQCKTNCSFVAGHPSIAFSTLSLALIAKRRLNNSNNYIIYSLIFGILSGIFRIAQGGHFLSDVIFSGYITCFFTIFIFNIFFKQVFKKIN